MSTEKSECCDGGQLPAKPKLYERYREEREQAQEQADMVNSPPHYQLPGGLEVIQITQHMDFMLGSVVKYVLRYDKKNGLEDLQKAAWYLNRKIRLIEEADIP
jgi:hypothetical protein